MQPLCYGARTVRAYVTTVTSERAVGTAVTHAGAVFDSPVPLAVTNARRVETKRYNRLKKFEAKMFNFKFSL